MGLAGVAFIIGVITGIMGVGLMGYPAESFSRACDNLALLAIAMMMMGMNGKGSSSP